MNSLGLYRAGIEGAGYAGNEAFSSPIIERILPTGISEQSSRGKIRIERLADLRFSMNEKSGQHYA